MLKYYLWKKWFGKNWIQNLITKIKQLLVLLSFSQKKSVSEVNDLTVTYLSPKSKDFFNGFISGN